MFIPLYPLGIMSWFILKIFPITIPPIPSNVTDSSVGIIAANLFCGSNLFRFAKKSLYAKSNPPYDKFALFFPSPFSAWK